MSKLGFPGESVAQSIKTLPGAMGAKPAPEVAQAAQIGQRIAQAITPAYGDLMQRYPQAPGGRLPNLVQPLGLSPYAPAQKPGLAPDQVGAAVGAALDRLKASSAGQGQSPQQAGNSL